MGTSLGAYELSHKCASDLDTFSSNSVFLVIKYPRKVK